MKRRAKKYEATKSVSDTQEAILRFTNRRVGYQPKDDKNVWLSCRNHPLFHTEQFDQPMHKNDISTSEQPLRRMPPVHREFSHYELALLAKNEARNTPRMKTTPVAPSSTKQSKNKQFHKNATQSQLLIPTNLSLFHGCLGKREVAFKMVEKLRWAMTVFDLSWSEKIGKAPIRPTNSFASFLRLFLPIILHLRISLISARREATALLVSRPALRCMS